MRAVAHLFLDGFRGFDPTLSLRETQLRELRGFHHWRNYPARWAGSGVPRLLNYGLLHRT